MKKPQPKAKRTKARTGNRPSKTDNAPSQSAIGNSQSEIENPPTPSPPPIENQQSEIENAVVRLRAYQERIFSDRDTGLLVLHWSRQIGKSYTLAAWAVDRLLAQLKRYDSWLITVLSNSRDNGAEFVAKCAAVSVQFGALKAEVMRRRAAQPGENQPPQDVGRHRDLSVQAATEKCGPTQRVIALLRMASLRLPDQQRQLDRICALPTRALNALTWRFESISLRRHRAERLPAGLPRNHIRRSAEVAEDYNRALAACTSDLILTLEDDMLPPNDAVRQLAAHIVPHGKVAAAAGVYPSARQPGTIAGSTNLTRWISDPVAGFPREALRAGWVAGGCTLFSHAALKRILPFQVRAAFPLRIGWGEGQGEVSELSEWNWDNDFSQKLRNLGYRLILDGRVCCQHNFPR